MRWKRGNRLQLVSATDAPERVRQMFSELRDSLGVPEVPALYRAYAVVPEFLELHWQTFRPVVQSRQFFLLGARLAAESYTRAHNYFEIPGLNARERTPASLGPLSLDQVLDYYQYLVPLLLLITVAQMQAFEGPVGREGGPADQAQHPVFPLAPRLPAEDEAIAPVRHIWEERRRLLDLAFLSDEHRALANWPDYYADYWKALKELMQSPLYADFQFRIVDSAAGMVRELPAQVETGVEQLLEAGLDNEQISSLMRINEAFVGAQSGLLLDVTFARIACEGGTRRDPKGRRQAAGEEVRAEGSPTRAA